MEHPISIYNTLTRKKGTVHPAARTACGMYVCGPTVYGDAHLGHARPAITFDLLFRYLTHIGYKVRYVRNITDVATWNMMLTMVKTRLPRRPVSNNSSRWKWCSIT